MSLDLATIYGAHVLVDNEMDYELERNVESYANQILKELGMENFVASAIFDEQKDEGLISVGAKFNEIDFLQQNTFAVEELPLIPLEDVKKLKRVVDMVIERLKENEVAILSVRMGLGIQAT